MASSDGDGTKKGQAAQGMTEDFFTPTFRSRNPAFNHDLRHIFSAHASRSPDTHAPKTSRTEKKYRT